MVFALKVIMSTSKMVRSLYNVVAHACNANCCLKLFLVIHALPLFPESEVYI